ncbi:MAG: LPXTG cell wall anchor domain-containing protein, partial [Defluviitaleaceae bacterium]|nr:LPXTG cell wall anchor domain-containing protein [Defluviitaleaceae bacterium]
AEPTEPVTTEPATAEPTEPVTTEPATAEPTEPVTTEPATAEPTEPTTLSPPTLDVIVEPLQETPGFFAAIGELIGINSSSTDDTEIEIGDTVLYQITVSNPNHLPIENYVVTYEIDLDAVAFVADSLNLNDEPVDAANYSFNSSTGLLRVTLPELPANASYVINFEATALSEDPFITPISANLTPTFEASLEPVQEEQGFLATVGEFLGINLSSSSISETNVQIGDTLRYQITIGNPNDDALGEHLVTNELNLSLVAFVPGSVNVNSGADTSSTYTFNPETGMLHIYFSELPANASYVINFEVIVRDNGNIDEISQISRLYGSIDESGNRPFIGSFNTTVFVDTAITTEPTHNTEIDNATEPTHNTEIDNATEPTHNTEIDNATEPTHNTEIDNATEPTHNTEIDNATEPTHSAEIDNATEPTHNAEIDNATEPTHSAEIDNATEPTHSAEIDNATEPTHNTEIDNATGPTHNAEIDNATGPTHHAEIDNGFEINNNAVINNDANSNHPDHPFMNDAGPNTRFGNGLLPQTGASAITAGIALAGAGASFVGAGSVLLAKKENK